MTPSKNKNTPKTTTRSFTGKVISNKMQNTIVVLLSYKSRHPIYRKLVKKNKKIYAENNLSAQINDTVKVAECRPLSKLKRFVTLEIIKHQS